MWRASQWPGSSEVVVPVKNSSYIQVPDYATSVRLRGSSAESGPISLPSSPGASATVELRAEKNPPNGFLYALGIHTPDIFTLTEDLSRPGLSRVKHLVVVMMEGRSFDHMLGGLRASNPYIDGLTGNETNPDTTGALTKVEPKAAYQELLPVNVNFPAVNLQLFNGAQGSPRLANMQGFILSSFSNRHSVDISRKVMYYFAPSMLPVLANLAQNYAICDHWFSSVPGPTFPNRAFVHEATSNGVVDNSLLAVLGPKTIYELLAEQGVTSKIYFYDQHSSNVDAGFLKKQPQFFATYDQFVADSEAGSLPAYSFVEPNFVDHHTDRGSEVASDEHVGRDVLAGEAFIAGVYQAIKSNPALWERSSWLLFTRNMAGCTNTCRLHPR